MSAVIDHGHGHEHHDHHGAHHGPYGGIMRWITTTNHKDIGTLYLWFSFIMFSVGGIMALVIRSELFSPGLQIVNPDFFNQMTTMHGLVMVFGAIMPAWVGLGNWMIPMLIGAPEEQRARLEALRLHQLRHRARVVLRRAQRHDLAVVRRIEPIDSDVERTARADRGAHVRSWGSPMNNRTNRCGLTTG